MISGVHHFAVIASSEASVEFYNKLGFNEIYRKVRIYDTVVLMEGYGIKLEVFVDPNHPKRETNPERLGLRHLSLKVDSCEEMSREYKCGPINRDWIGENYCYTEDPDGLVIEFHE